MLAIRIKFNYYDLADVCSGFTLKSVGRVNSAQVDQCITVINMFKKDHNF